MSSKKENTRDHILQKAAPLFNKKGYVATSLSDLEASTQLTKGAIYRHYESKENLAIQCFKENLKKVIAPLALKVQQQEKAIDKLKAVTAYYRTYYDLAHGLGGCPLLNIGIDTHFTNPQLFKIAQNTSLRLEKDLQNILSNGIGKGELKPMINPSEWAKNIFAMIEGSIFLAFLHEDNSYIELMMDRIDEMIDNQLSS